MDKFKSFIYQNKKILTGLLVIMVIIFLIWILSENSSTTGNSALAKCLKENGAKFYGASWCPHCKSQKALFGNGASDLPYIECSDANNKQKKECSDAGVTGYPTWKFGDGTKQSGEMTLSQLKQKTGC